jgi:corrinoid protein of di/trimethylamine methyltransferase
LEVRVIPNKEDLYEKLYNAIMDQDIESAGKIAKEIVSSKADPEKGIAKASAAMTKLGEMFDSGEVFLPQVVIAADAMKAASDILIPASPSAMKAGKPGKILIGTVEGDVHDIGKGIVATMLESAGFEINDLGRDVPLKTFIEKAKEFKPNIIGASALMTVTRVGQKTIIDMLKQENLKGKIKVMVGGGATTGEWAQQIGADAWGEDAPDAVRKALKLVGK